MSVYSRSALFPTLNLTAHLNPNFMVLKRGSYVKKCDLKIKKNEFLNLKHKIFLRAQTNIFIFIICDHSPHEEAA